MNNEPRTPLPWEELPKCDEYDGDDNPCGYFFLSEDENFMLHASNAYAKAIQCLKDSISSDPAVYVRAPLDAYDLLKELGEL